MGGRSLLTYPQYTVVAEKVEALVLLGMSNSRMKDYFDLWILGQHAEFDGQILSNAITATFQSRQSAIPSKTPLGLSSTFSTNPRTQKNWLSFLKKNDLQAGPLEEVVAFLNQFLLKPMEACRESKTFNNHWKQGGPWQAIGLQNQGEKPKTRVHLQKKKHFFEPRNPKTK